MLVGGGIIFLLWTVFLTPLAAQNRRLEKQIESYRTQLESGGYLTGEAALNDRLTNHEFHHQALLDEWTTIREHMNAFPKEKTQKKGFGRIHYKVALSTVRQRLMRKAMAMKISLPYRLGMEDDVLSTDNARKLMHQLRSVEHLIDLLLDLKIKAVRHIKPQATISHEIKGAVYLEEYPIEVQFYCTLGQLYALFDAIMKPEHCFTMRQLRTEAPPKAQKGTLRVSAVISAAAFLADPKDVKAEVKPMRRLTPLGH